MITSGLIVTLNPDSRLATQAAATIAERAEFSVGERNDRWLPLAMEARDDAHSRDLHDWISALPGVAYVDVVSVNFEEPEHDRVEDQLPHEMKCDAPWPVEHDPAGFRPASEVNHEH